KKAFDTVWHEGLLLKLQRAGINGKIYELIQSMYQGSVSRIKCKQTLTEPIIIRQGVHQGNVLSPLLFNIFINDIGNELFENDAPQLHDSFVNHLLYADDLVLLSTSEEELQKNILQVHNYCSKWGLVINTNKSKVMVFSKSGRLPKDAFTFFVGEDELEYVKQYKYLGVNISSTAKFSVAEANLSLKANRALFSIKQSIFNKNIKPSAVLNIFDALVKPIALYASELWSPYKPCYKNKTLDEMFELSLKSSSEYDKLYIKFCKYLLGVHSKACNFAVLSELGQYPLLITILTSSINFWLHIIQSSCDSLVAKAYLEQINGPNDRSIWVQFIKNVMCDLGFSHVWNNHYTFNSSNLLNAIKSKLKERYISFWQKRMAGEEGMKKLQLYRLLKQNFKFESYLDDLHDKVIRKCLCAFRISAHRLRIERGRYCGEKPEERLCDNCNTIENEVHFLCQCNKYNVLRSKMFDSIKDISFTACTTSEETFMSIMTSKDIRIVKAVATFIRDCQII
ncbi:MAG: reverse transcriptase family protein, partial [Candidatus Thiodiazotropha sp.]